MKTTKTIIKRKEEWKKEEKRKGKRKEKRRSKRAKRKNTQKQIIMENVEEKMPAWIVRKEKR